MRPSWLASVGFAAVLAASAAPAQIVGDCGAVGDPGCSDPVCEACVCSVDDICCFLVWDSVCVDIAANDCAASCVEAAEPDSDGDGLPDGSDACPNSDLSATVVIDGCDSGVANTLAGDGCTLADDVADCAATAADHSDFVSCVSALTNQLKADKLLSGAQKGAIQSCAGQAALP
jgi:hypothetical protein